MSEVPHLGFIVAAYAVTVATLGGAVVALVMDRRAQRRLLARFDQPEDASGGRP